MKSLEWSKKNRGRGSKENASDDGAGNKDKKDDSNGKREGRMREKPNIEDMRWFNCD